MLLDLLITEPLNFILLALTLAIIPLIIWTFVFYRKHPVDRNLAIWTTIGGMMSVLPIWAYQWLFERYEHLDIFSAIQALDFDQKIIYLLTFVAVGIIEEQFKHWVVVLIDNHKKEWRGIADAIEFAILAALGFAFIENIVYFLGIVKFEGFQALIVPFVFRSAFSTFAHIFFSGVYGYHFGIAKHAREWIIEEMGPKHHHKFIITRWLYRLFKIRFFNITARILSVGATIFLSWKIIVYFHLPILQNPTETFIFKMGASMIVFVFLIWLAHAIYVFWHHLRRIQLDEILIEEEYMEGLFLAMFFHAIFNFILWLELTWLIPFYLFGGFTYLAHELRIKENLLDFEEVEERLRRVATEKDKKSSMKEKVDEKESV